MITVIIIIFLTFFVLSVKSGESLYKYHQTAKCCNKIDHQNDLLDCIQKVDYGTKDIAIISYASSDTLDYASYAFAINSAYAEQNGYEIYFLNEAGSNYEPRDARWNRVKIIEQALEVDEGWLNTVDYIVWMDSDLIVLDMNFDIRKIIASHRNSDIIISAERHAETGVANTGCFIMKNSAWSRNFVHEWWTKFDRSVAHDQIFFDKLYKSKLPNIKKHVTILEVDEMNSTPPPILWQKDDNKVLHLMGQPTGIRLEAFVSGFDEVCQAYVEKRQQQHQLGLTQPRLLNMASNYHETDIRNRLVALNSSLSVEVGSESFEHEMTSPDDFFANIDALRESTIQLGIFGGADVIVYIRALRKLIKRRLLLESQNLSPDRMIMLSLHNFAAVNGNDLVNHVRDPDEKIEILDEVEESISKMLSLIHKESMHIAQELQIRHYISRGEFYLSRGEVEKTQEAYSLAKDLFTAAATGAQNPVIMMDIKLGLGTSFCMSKAMPSVYKGLVFFDEAIEMQENFLKDEEHIKEDHIKLALTYLRYTGCLAKSGQFEKALENLDKCVEICEVHPNRAAASAYLEHSLKLRKSLRTSLAEARLDNTGSDDLLEGDSSPSTVESAGTVEQDNVDKKGDSQTRSIKKKLMRRKKKKKSEL